MISATFFVFLSLFLNSVAVFGSKENVDSLSLFQVQVMCYVSIMNYVSSEPCIASRSGPFGRLAPGRLASNQK